MPEGLPLSREIFSSLYKERCDMRMIGFISIAALLFWLFSYENNIAYSQERFVDTKIDYKTPNGPGEKFSGKYGGPGECADFVKESRPELQLGNDGKERPVGYAGNMINLAKAEGYEVNKLPRVGAVLIMPNVKVKGVPYGHAAIVTKVEEVKGVVYTLTIRDANADGQVKDGISNVDERPITYNVSGNGIPTINDPKRLGEQKNVAFIHEKQSIYNALKAKTDFESTNLTTHRPNIIAKTTRVAQEETLAEKLNRLFPTNIERPIENIIPTQDKARGYQFTDQFSTQELIDLGTSRPLVRHD